MHDEKYGNDIVFDPDKGPVTAKTRKKQKIERELQKSLEEKLGIGTGNADRFNDKHELRRSGGSTIREMAGDPYKAVSAKRLRLLRKEAIKRGWSYYLWYLQSNDKDRAIVDSLFVEKKFQDKLLRVEREMRNLAKDIKKCDLAIVAYNMYLRTVLSVIEDLKRGAT